jgi:hypothetical protein
MQPSRGALADMSDQLRWTPTRLRGALMTVRQVVWFIAAHVTFVALAIWFNLAVLCEGDLKYSGGCGGFSVYIPLWQIFLAPLPLAAVLLERWKRAEPPPTSRLMAYLVGIVIVAEVGFLLIDRFPVLLGLEAAAIVLAAIVRWHTAVRQSKARLPKEFPC